MKLKTGDQVRILAGKDKGKTGSIIQVFPRLERVVVEGLNMRKRHLRAASGRRGQIVDFPAPLHVSNVALVSSDKKTTGRVGYKVIGQGKEMKKVRVLRKSGTTQDID